MIGEYRVTKEDIHILEQYLPWSVSVLSILESGSYLRAIKGHLPGNIGLLNGYMEWSVFFTDIEELKNVLEAIRSLGKDCRVIVYTKHNFNADEVFKNEKFHVEDLMHYKEANSVMECKFELATEKYISDLAKMQKDYCAEEVSWKPYHKPLSAFEDEYAELIPKGRVFIVGNPPHTKIEITAKYMDYLKIGRIYTASKFRRKGYAQACLKGMLAWCAENNLSASLTVRKSNIAAKQLYLKNGFSIIGQVVYLFFGGDPK